MARRYTGKAVLHLQEYDWLGIPRVALALLHLSPLCAGREPSAARVRGGSASPNAWEDAPTRGHLWLPLPLTPTLSPRRAGRGRRSPHGIAVEPLAARLHPAHRRVGKMSL